MNHGYASRFSVGMLISGFALLFIFSGCKNSATGSGTLNRSGVSNSPAPISSPTSTSSPTHAYPTSNAPGPARAPRASAEELKKKPTLAAILAAHGRKPASTAPATSGTPVPATAR